MNDRGILATYLVSLLSKCSIPEDTTQYKLLKDSNSNRVDNLLKHNTLPITLYNNLLTFRDTGTEFELQGDLLKMITNKIYNVDLASLTDKKLLYDFAKEMHFDVRGPGNKSTGDRKLIKSLKSPAIMASGISNTIFLSSDPEKLCRRLKFLLQEKHVGNNSDLINMEVFAILDKFLKYRCISKKQHKLNLNKCNLLHEKVSLLILFYIINFQTK